MPWQRPVESVVAWSMYIVPACMAHHVTHLLIGPYMEQQKQSNLSGSADERLTTPLSSKSNTVFILKNAANRSIYDRKNREKYQVVYK